MSKLTAQVSLEEETYEFFTEHKKKHKLKNLSQAINHFTLNYKAAFYTSEEEKPVKANTEYFDFAKEIYEYYIKVSGKNPKTYKLTEKRKTKIRQRLADKFTLDQLKVAIDNFFADDWEGRAKHNDLELLFRNYEMTEKWINQNNKKVPRHDDRTEEDYHQMEAELMGGINEIDN